MNVYTHTVQEARRRRARAVHGQSLVVDHARLVFLLRNEQDEEAQAPRRGEKKITTHGLFISLSLTRSLLRVRVMKINVFFYARRFLLLLLLSTTTTTTTNN